MNTAFISHKGYIKINSTNDDSVKREVIDLLVNSEHHILIIGEAGSGKTKLIKEAGIPDSKYYDFTKDLESFNLAHYKFLTDELVPSIDFFGSNEGTLILDAVVFQQTIAASNLITFIKTARKRGKRMIILAYPDNVNQVIDLFSTIIHLE